MPPIRSFTAQKPVKTERTHEENQERAYIAASRRSDRSLEARVESARRASEIHKRRTGRSLRVTEQDVVNEEMYEEEDDDLPLQYRRLTAHLNSGDPHFNRRLAAYLTNHVAMRTALDQAISSSYAQQQQYPSGQLWAQPFQQMPQQLGQQIPQQMPQQQQQQQQQPWMMNQMSNQQSMAQGPFPNPMMMPPQMINKSPASYRQAPYPTPATPGYRPNMPHRPSAAIPHDSQSPMQGYSVEQIQPEVQNVDQRRMSAPAQPAPFGTTLASLKEGQGLQSSQRNSSSSSLPELKSHAKASPPKSSSVPPSAEHETGFAIIEPAAGQSHSPSERMNISPLTTSLPPETQMFFNSGAGFDNSGLFASGPVSSMEHTQQPFYSYNPNNFNKPRNIHPSYDGMNQTLAPGALDTVSDPFNWGTPSSACTEGAPTPFTPVFNYSFDPMFSDAMQKPSYAMQSPHIQGSGYVSPPEADWTAFIDPNSWAETAA